MKKKITHKNKKPSWKFKLEIRKVISEITPSLKFGVVMEMIERGRKEEGEELTRMGE